jgi:hypothetical protein
MVFTLPTCMHLCTYRGPFLDNRPSVCVCVCVCVIQTRGDKGGPRPDQGSYVPTYLRHLLKCSVGKWKTGQILDYINLTFDPFLRRARSTPRPLGACTHTSDASPTGVQRERPRTYCRYDTPWIRIIHRNGSSLFVNLHRAV